jgi:hypothetical protein
MNTYLPRLDDSRDAWVDFTAQEIDATAELGAVIASLESMRMDPSLPDVSGATLLNIHAALLLFQLGGRTELLPSVALFSFGQRFVERRVIAAARRLAVSNDSYVNWLSAGRQIEQLIGCIDSELADAIHSVA